MSLQNRAFRIVRDVIGIVLDWNDRYLSDKEAMKEITRSLLIHKENQRKEEKFDLKEDFEIPKENPEEIQELEKGKKEIIKDRNEEIQIEENEKEKRVQIKKNIQIFQKVKDEKKLIAPIIIACFFVLVVVGFVNPYEIASNLEFEPDTKDKSIQLREIPSDNKAIRTEQFLEIPSEGLEKIQNGTKVTLEP